jgi:hypothetical protein
MSERARGRVCSLRREEKKARVSSIRNADQRSVSERPEWADLAKDAVPVDRQPTNESAFREGPEASRARSHVWTPRARVGNRVFPAQSFSDI